MVCPLVTVVMPPKPRILQMEDLGQAEITAAEGAHYVHGR